MGRKSILITLVLTITAFLAGILIGSDYKSDAGFRAFNHELSAMVDEIVTEIDANPTSQGVLKAREILSDRKSELRNKLADLKDVQASHPRGATITEFGENLDANRVKLQELITVNPRVKQAVKTDAEFRKGIAALIADYHSIIK